MIYISMMEDDYQPQYTNKSKRNSTHEDIVGDDIDYRHHVLDDECDPWENKLVTVSVPHDSVPRSHSHDRHGSFSHSRHGSHRHGNSLHFHHSHKAADRLRKGSTVSNYSVPNDYYYRQSDDCEPISTMTSHRGQEMYLSPPHDTHTSSHDTTSHDTHTSSHDTNDIGGCDTGGDCGGGGDD